MTITKEQRERFQWYSTRADIGLLGYGDGWDDFADDLHALLVAYYALERADAQQKHKAFEGISLEEFDKRIACAECTTPQECKDDFCRKGHTLFYNCTATYTQPPSAPVEGERG